ncbi:MFS transporter [Pseudoglutamicibacter albus]|uniref:MFS transporter n=1 Tax=Pseudoglutamicibacter albus TaxID=98671 RepID=UPI0036089E49
MRTRTFTTKSGAPISRMWIMILCWTTVALEGFDLVALGATTPILTNPAAPHAGLTTEAMTVVATVSLIGVGVGAVVIGPLTYRWGRRRTLLACVALFSIFTVALPLMPAWQLIALFRLIAGVGLGASMPVALTLMQETMASGRRAHASTVTMTGYHAGAVAASSSRSPSGTHGNGSSTSAVPSASS